MIDVRLYLEVTTSHRYTEIHLFDKDRGQRLAVLNSYEAHQLLLALGDTLERAKVIEDNPLPFPTDEETG